MREGRECPAPGGRYSVRHPGSSAEEEGTSQSSSPPAACATEKAPPSTLRTASPQPDQHEQDSNEGQGEGGHSSLCVHPNPLVAVGRKPHLHVLPVKPPKCPCNRDPWSAQESARMHTDTGKIGPQLIDYPQPNNGRKHLKLKTSGKESWDRLTRSPGECHSKTGP